MRFCYHFAVVWATCCLAAGALRAQVQWLPDADGEWEDAANWSSHPLLPGATDDVVIDVGGATMRNVTITGSHPSVLSLNSQEMITVSNNGSLTVGAGGGQINGGLAMPSPARVISSPFTVFEVSVCKKLVLVKLPVIGYHGGYGKAVHGS